MGLLYNENLLYLPINKLVLFRYKLLFYTWV